MPKLSIGEMEEFLTTGSKILKLGTVTAGGYPYVNPLWYSYEKDVFLVAGRSKAVWVSHIKKNPKTSLSIKNFSVCFCNNPGVRSHVCIYTE